ncbi:single-strand binding family protein [Ostertagia ostertagi]
MPTAMPLLCGCTLRRPQAEYTTRGFLMIEGLVAGRLYGDVEQRTDKAGKPFTVARVRASTGDGEVLFVNVIVFDAAARADIGRLVEGDAISLTGALTPRVWTDKQGNTRPALDMVARRILALPVDGEGSHVNPVG